MSIAFRVIIEDQPLGYHPALAKVCGGLADGVMLGRLLYWDGIMARKYGDKYSGEFYKSDTELADETGLSHSEIKTAKKHLKAAKFITIQVRGIPPTSHYHIEIDNLQAAIESGQPVRVDKRTHGERGRFTKRANQLAIDGELKDHNMVNQKTTKWRDIQNSTQDETQDRGETKNVSLPQKELKPKPQSAATQKALAQARSALQEWERKTDDEHERGAAIADPRRAKQAFVKEYAPLVAQVFGRSYPISEDRGATGDIFNFHCDAAWLRERLTAYGNGSGDEYRHPTKDGRKPVAYWLRDRIEREWAETRQELEDAKQRAEERADYERRCAAALGDISTAEHDVRGAPVNPVYLSGALSNPVGDENGDELGETGSAVVPERGVRVRGNGVDLRGVSQPQVAPGQADGKSRSVREMFRDYKRSRHLSAVDGKIQKAERGPGG